MASVEFYNLYCPAMLKYLGLTADSTTERDQWDIVQTVFTRFYKTFALTADPKTGQRVIPRDLMKALIKTDRKTGKTVNVSFRQYLKICLKNAVRAKWRAETHAGKIDAVSIDTRVAADKDGTWKDVLESQGVDPKGLDMANEEGERLAAVWGIWRAVLRGFLFDESIEDWKQDSIYQVLAKGASVADMAAQWGIRKNVMEVTLTDAEFAELKELRNLAPGDFRTVRQENFYLADEQTNFDRIAALKEECALKKDGDHISRIGFVA